MNRLRTLCVPPLALVLTAALAACGGGGSAPLPVTPTTCNLPLQYANGSSSGIGITPQATSSDRLFDTCNMTRLQTAKLTVCIDHPNLSEVSGQLRLSGNSVLDLSANSGTAVGTSCLAQSGGATTVREFTLASSHLAGTSFSSGPWSVTLSDTVSGYGQGNFVAWALELQGLR